jgi:hypothetical protein
MGWILPAIAGGTSLLSSLFGNKAKQNQANEQSKLYNDWLKQYMGTGQSLMQGAMGQGWNPFGAQTSTSTGTTSSSGGGRQSTTPTITGNYQGCRILPASRPGTRATLRERSTRVMRGRIRRLGTWLLVAV